MKRKLVPIVAISALLALGTPFITSCGEETANQVISVESVDLSSDKTTLKVGETAQLTTTVSPETASDKKVTYSVSPTGVVSVSDTGVVTALKAGEATITVTTVDRSKTDTVTIKVEEDTVAVTGVEVIIDKASIEVGGTAQLTTTVSPENATNKKFTYSATPADVVSISETGLVTGLKAGNATITVTTEDGNHTDSVDISVNPALDIILSVPQESYTVDAGEDLVIDYSAETSLGDDMTDLVEVEDYNDPNSFDIETKTFNSLIAGEHELSFYVESEENPDVFDEKVVKVTVNPGNEENFDITGFEDPAALSEFGTFKDNFSQGISSPMYAGNNDTNHASYLSSLKEEAISGNSLIVNPNATAGSSARSLFFNAFNNSFPRGIKTTYSLSFKYKVLEGSASDLSDVYIGLSYDEFNGINRNFIASTGSEIGTVYEYSTTFTEVTIPSDRNAYFFLFKLSGAKNSVKIAIDDFVITATQSPETTDVIASSEDLMSEDGFTFNWSDKSCPVVNGESVLVSSIADEDIRTSIETHPEYFGTAVKHFTNTDDHIVNGTTADSFVAGMVLTVEFYYYAVNDNSLVYLMMGASNPSIQDVKTETIEGNIKKVTLTYTILAGQYALNIYAQHNSDFDIYLGNMTMKLTEGEPIPEDETPGGNKLGTTWKKDTRQWGDANEDKRAIAKINRPEAVTGELMAEQVTKMTFKANQTLDTTIEFFQTGNTMEAGQEYDIVIPYYVEKDFPETAKLQMKLDNADYIDMETSQGYHEFKLDNYIPKATVDFFCFYGKGEVPTEDLVFYVSYVEYTLVGVHH